MGQLGTCSAAGFGVTRKYVAACFFARLPVKPSDAIADKYMPASRSIQAGKPGIETPNVCSISTTLNNKTTNAASVAITAMNARFL